MATSLGRNTHHLRVQAASFLRWWWWLCSLQSKSFQSQRSTLFRYPINFIANEKIPEAILTQLDYFTIDSFSKTWNHVQAIAVTVAFSRMCLVGIRIFGVYSSSDKIVVVNTSTICSRYSYFFHSPLHVRQGAFQVHKERCQTLG